MKPSTLTEIARVAGGTLVGRGDLVLRGIRALAEAGPEDLSFVAGPKFASAARQSRAGALIVNDVGLAAGKPAVLHSNPQVAIALVLESLVPAEKPAPGISPHADVSPSATLGRDVSLAAGVFVGDGARIGDGVVLGRHVYIGPGAEIGEGTVVDTGAVIEHHCRLGAKCRIYSGAVIGADGFGYVWDGERHRKIPQVGIVVLEDEVEVGANACIDRAALAETRIGRGTRIDNLVQIGHNVTVGEHSLVCAQAGVAGSARIGRGVTLAGQAGIADRMVIGDRAIVSAQAGVMRDVEPRQVVSGMPAEPHRDFLRREAAADRLPEALARLRVIEEKLGITSGRS